MAKNGGTVTPPEEGRFVEPNWKELSGFRMISKWGVEAKMVRQMYHPQVTAMMSGPLFRAIDDYDSCNGSAVLSQLA